MMGTEILNSIAEAVGNTPLVRLNRFGSNLSHNLLAKCEFLNPGGSVKDRIAFYMIESAQRRGELKPGGTIVEATAGNTGIGLAIAAALNGYKLVTVMSQKVSKDKVNLLRALGSETIIVPSGLSLDSPDNFVNTAKRIAAERGAWLSNQFNNEDNVRVHYECTGPEIWRQTNGEVDVLVAGVGTGGTISGAGRFLKEKKASVKVVLADPVGSALTNLLRNKTNGTTSAYLAEGIGGDYIPGNYHDKLVDDAIQVSDADTVASCYRLMNEEGMFVGSSAGCIAAAASRYAERLPEKGKTIVAIFPDGGRGYLSTIYDAAWIKEKLGAQFHATHFGKNTAAH